MFWLKILLPLVALGLLSTLFLVARATDPDLAIRYADVDVAALSKDEQVTGPAYSGVTRDGTSVTVVAATVRPGADDPDQFEARTVSGRLAFRTGATAEMIAPEARLDPEGDLLHFEGGVTLLSSDGYRFETEALATALDRTEIVAETEVRGSGPEVTLRAGSMRITQDAAGGHLVVFNEGVRLVYTPAKTRE